MESGKVIFSKDGNNVLTLSHDGSIKTGDNYNREVLSDAIADCLVKNPRDESRIFHFQFHSDIERKVVISELVILPIGDFVCRGFMLNGEGAEFFNLLVKKYAEKLNQKP